MIAPLIALACLSATAHAAILDYSWGNNVPQRVDPLWKKVVDASVGWAASCQSLGTPLDISNPAQEFPFYCQSRAIALGSDTFDVAADLSRCFFQKCTTFTGMNFTRSLGGRSTYTYLAGSWTQILRHQDNYDLTCVEDLGNYSVGLAETFPEVCYWHAMARNADSFNANQDNTTCTFKRCGTYAQISKQEVSSGSGSNAFTILGGNFNQLTLADENVSASCRVIEDSINHGSQPSQGGSGPPLACVTSAFIHGADTIDVKSTTCDLLRCSDIGFVRFSTAFGKATTYTSLGGNWVQLTRSAEGKAVDCREVGNVTLPGGAGFPQACHSKAFVVGADTYDAEPDGSRCYFKQCGSLANIRFHDQPGGRASFTVLTLGWSMLVLPQEGVAPDCPVQRSVSLPSTASNREQTCLAEAAIEGANVADLGTSQCDLKKCSSNFGALRMTASSGPVSSYTLLSPRDSTYCDPANCMDLHIMWTAKLQGLHLPVRRGRTCDEDELPRCSGGVARRLGFSQQRRELYAQRNESFVLLDLGGSTFGGVLWDPLNASDENDADSWGGASARLMNFMPYDFCGFSTRDFLAQPDKKVQQKLVDSYMQRDCNFVLSNGRFNNARDLARRGWEAFNDKLETWAVKTMPNGWKVAFVGLFPETHDYGWTFTNKVLTLNPRSLLHRLLKGSPEALRGVMQLNMTRFSENLQAADYNYELLSSHEQDVFTLSTVIPIDVLIAASEAKLRHPDVQATVLMVSGSRRQDQVDWLAAYGGFDVILRETEQALQVVPNEIAGKNTLIVGSETFDGVGMLSLRLRQGVGVEHYSVEANIPLDIRTPPAEFLNETVVAELSRLYQRIQIAQSGTYGRISAPVVGGHRTGEKPPSINQCYITDCNVGTVIGDALLWKARARSSIKVHGSLYNLGGWRAALTGDENGHISLPDCQASLSFKNSMKIYTVSGQALYKAVEGFVKAEERGLIGAGWRAVYYEPCFSYVNHLPPYSWGSYDFDRPPGSDEELQRCRAELGLSEATQDVYIVQMQIEDPKNWTDCQLDPLDPLKCEGEWKALQKAAEYTLVSMDFLMGTTFDENDYQSVDGLEVGVDADILCEYIKAQSDKNGQLNVESWEVFRDRGSVAYATVQDAWDNSVRLGAVNISESIIGSAPLCSSGMYLDGRECKLCQAGRHSQIILGVPVCNDCATGFFANEDGQTSCEPCQAGRFQNVTGESFCWGCEPGRYISETGREDCDACKPGFFANDTNSSECSGCVHGTYAPETGSTACTKCGDTLVTREPFSTTKSNCVCDSGSFRLETQTTCSACYEGMTCPFGSEESYYDNFYQCLEQDGLTNCTDKWPVPLLQEQYWSDRTKPLEVFGCQSKFKCPGLLIGTCAPGLVGRACDDCEGRFYWNGRECSPCSDHWGVYPLIPLLLTPVLVVVMYHTTKGRLADWSSASSLISTLGFLVLRHYQILNLMRDAARKTPDKVLEVVDFWAWSNNPLSVFESNCVGLKDFRVRNTTYAFSPFMFIGIAIVVTVSSWVLAVYRRSPRLMLEIDGMHNVIGNFLFTFYLGFVSQTMSLFGCVPNPSGKQTIRNDRAIECYTGDDWQVAVFPSTLCAMLLFCVLPVACTKAVLFAPCYGRFREPEFQWRWKFLFCKFRPDGFWYGLVLLARDTLINLGLVVFKTDTALLYWVMSSVICYIGFFIAYLPFRFQAANLMEICCCTSLSFCCLFLLRFTSPSQEVDDAIILAYRPVTITPMILGACCATSAIRRHLISKTLIFLEAEALVEQIKDTCVALVYLPDEAGTDIWSNIGETDIATLRHIVSLIEAEVLGVGSYRLSSGITARKYSHLARDSQARVSRNASVFLNQPAKDERVSVAGGRQSEYFGETSPRPQSESFGESSPRPKSEFFGESSPRPHVTFVGDSSPRQTAVMCV